MAIASPPRLPKAHYSRVTWVALVTLVVVVAYPATVSATATPQALRALVPPDLGVVRGLTASNFPGRIRPGHMTRGSSSRDP